MNDEAPQPSHRGRWFEDYAVGDRVVTAARTLTEGDVAAFAALSWDTNALHTDAVFARKTAFRGQIAHGMLIQSATTGLAAQTGMFDGTILAFERSEVRFLKAVKAGQTIHASLETRKVDPEPTRRRGRIGLRVRTYNEALETVCEAEWDVLVLRRSKDA